MEFKPAKKLRFGLMRMPLLDPSDEAAVDVEQVCRMVDMFLDRDRICASSWRIDCVKSLVSAPIVTVKPAMDPVAAITIS